MIAGLRHLRRRKGMFFGPSFFHLHFDLSHHFTEGKGRPAEVVLVTPRREVRGLQYYLVL